jgi:hypothetical protein
MAKSTRILGVLGAIFLAVAPLTVVAEDPGATTTKSRPRLGINLSGPADWNTELPFVDVFRFSRPWISQKQGEGWGKGPALALDEHGWVKRLETDCWAETPLCTIEGGHYPSGEYTVLYDGDGTFDVSGAATATHRERGRMTIHVDSTKGGFFLRLLATDPKDYVRNIRVLMPGFEKTYREQPFHPEFLKHWQGMACLRFMDWMQTNGSKLRSWSERPTPQDATFSQKGVALETMIDLCNRLKADPWFCMPHLADDEYVRKFAAMVGERLAPDRKVYVEYSNEVWNGMFPQSKYAGEEGIQRGFAEKPWEAAWRYTAYRSVQIFRIWEQTLGKERLVRVFPSQAANSYVSEQIVGFRDAWKEGDALAIAPYVTCNVASQGKPSAGEVENWSVDQALDYMERSALPESIRWIKEQKKVADKHHLKLLAYEGGQHMVGVMGVENNAAITKLLHAANRHPRMGKVYGEYYAAWARADGDLFCYFASTGSWSKWGSWGILEWFDEDPAKSPKFMATMRWAEQCGQKVNVPK